ncbi:MAG: hypothetical protein CM1200mP10_16400 [Candidatus Neomarinimicrobiota bacterium]|nr:MAG: hypothetical protein CM1200mP10_16400 [Candidatus Neomarinimicrobiota bacterium]
MADGELTTIRWEILGNFYKAGRDDEKVWTWVGTEADGVGVGLCRQEHSD